MRKTLFLLMAMLPMLAMAALPPSVKRSGITVGLPYNITVDETYGDDATAARNGLPFKTVSNAVYAAQNGDGIYISPGQYTNDTFTFAVSGDAAIKLLSKTNINIYSPGCTVRSTVTNESPILIVSNCNKITIEGITFQGAWTDKTWNSPVNHSAVEVERCADVTFNRCTLNHWPRQGIADLSAARVNSNITVSACTFYFIGSTNGPDITPPGVDGVATCLFGENTKILHNTFRACMRGIEIQGLNGSTCAGSVISGNTFETPAGVKNQWDIGFIIGDTTELNAKDVLITENTFINGEQALYISVGHGIKFHNNQVIKKTNGIVGVQGGDNLIEGISIQGNTFKNIHFDSIAIEDIGGSVSRFKDVDIAGNYFEGVGRNGVGITAENVNIRNNIFNSCAINTDENHSVIKLIAPADMVNERMTNAFIVDNIIYDTNATFRPVNCILVPQGARNVFVRGNSIDPRAAATVIKFRADGELVHALDWVNTDGSTELGFIIDVGTNMSVVSFIDVVGSAPASTNTATISKTAAWKCPHGGTLAQVGTTGTNFAARSIEFLDADMITLGSGDLNWTFTGTNNMRWRGTARAIFSRP